MADIFHQYENLVVWAVYALAGLGCCIVWWKITASLSNRGWRDLARGLVLVLIYTPWYAGESREFFAPAIMVLVMDLLLEGAKGGLQGGLILLCSLFVMLLGLTLRLIFGRRPRQALPD
jgi:hypothetical protein